MVEFRDIYYNYMKRILTILLALTFAATAFNQTINQYLVDASGNPIMIGGSYIAFVYETPTEPEWEDSVAFTQLFLEDWQDFTVTNTTTATSPVGIPNDSLAANITNFEALTSDSANDPDKADNADIVELAALNVLRSWYPEGHCCTGGPTDEGLNGGLNNGTGIEFVASLTSPSTHTRKVIMHYWVRFPESTDVMGLFENPEGVKQPGLVVDYVNDEAIARTMILNYSAGTEFDPAYYTYAYWNQPTDWVTPTGPVTNTKTKTPDIWFTPGWHLVSIAFDAGTAQGVNGYMHLYIDGKLIDDGAGGGTRSSIPFLNGSSPSGWRQLKFASFMGGNYEAYNSPKDQAIDFGPISIEVQPGYDETPVAGQDIYVPYYMKSYGLSWN